MTFAETPKETERKFQEKLQAFQDSRWLSGARMIELLENEAQRRRELERHHE